jgi:hypothetical protein
MSSLAARFCLTSLAGRLPRPAGMGAARGIAQSSSGAPLKAGSAGVGCAGQLSSRMKTISGHHTAFPRSAAMRSFPSLSHMGRVGAGARGLCMPAEEYNKRIQDVNDQFAEARLLIEVSIICASPSPFCTRVVFFPHREAPDSLPLHAANIAAPPSTMSPRIPPPLT